MQPQIHIQPHPTLCRANVNDRQPRPWWVRRAGPRQDSPSADRPIDPRSDHFLFHPSRPSQRARGRRRNERELKRGAAGPYASDRVKPAEGSMLLPDPRKGRSLPCSWSASAFFPSSLQDGAFFQRLHSDAGRARSHQSLLPVLLLRVHWQPVNRWLARPASAPASMRAFAPARTCW